MLFGSQDEQRKKCKTERKHAKVDSAIDSNLQLKDHPSGMDSFKNLNSLRDLIETQYKNDSLL